MQVQVFAQTVKGNDRIVQRIADNGQHGCKHVQVKVYLHKGQNAYCYPDRDDQADHGSQGKVQLQKEADA